MSQKIKTSVEIDGSLKASQIANATTDTDKFLVSDSGTVKYRTGAEVLSDLGITVNTASKLQHQVKAGVAINKGQAVYVTSADGTNMIVGLASNASEATSSKTMGLLDGTVAINGFANVVTEGLLSGLSITGAVSEGDPVWLGTGGNLIYGLANKPYAPNHLVFIGIVTRVNANNGEIFVKVQNGFELDEIHDVDLKTTTKVNGHLLGYNGSLWVNKTIAEWLGYTPYNASNPAGYISTYTETDTLASVTGRGATTGTSITVGGVFTTKGTNPYIQWQNSAGTRLGYIQHATNLVMSSDTGNIEFTPNSGLVKMLGHIRYGGASAYSSTGLDSNGFYQDVNGTNIYESTMRLQSNILSGVSSYNGLKFGAAAIGNASEGFTIFTGGYDNNRLTINASGNATFGVDARAPIFYDSNDTSYYTNPASTSVLSSVVLRGASAISFYGAGSGTYNIGSIYSSTSINSWEAPLETDSYTAARVPFILTWRGGYAAKGGLKLTGDASGELGGNVILHAGNYSSYAVPTSRTITINGTSYDLSANRSWTVTASETDTLATVVARGDTTGGGRPIRLDTSGGGVSIRGSVGGWATGYYFMGSSNTYRGGFGALGDADGLSNYWIGPAYNNFYTYIDASQMTHTSSMRAPIFYDSNDTGFYTDPSSTSVLRHLLIGGSVPQGYGTAYGYIAALRSPSGTQTFMSIVRPGATADTDGVILGEDTTNTYLYQRRDVPIQIGTNNSTRLYIYGSSNYTEATGSLRAPIFYDSNDTAYYVNPAGDGQRAAVLNGNLWITPKSESYGEGVTFNMPNQATWGGLRWYRNGSAGGYAGNWAFGYFGNESNNDVGFHNGTNGWRLDHSFNMTSVGSVRSPIFYDSNDTGYYVDPASTSNVNQVVTGILRFRGEGGDSGNGSLPTSYGIYQQGGSWTHPYPDLCIGFHTGIKIGAHYGYNGTRFYNNSDWATITASVNDGDNNFRGYYDVIAYASDRRLKHKVKPIDNALSKVKSLTGMTYQWNEIGKEHGWDPATEVREAGVFAQDVQAVLPEAVRLAPFDDDHGVSRSGESFLTVKYDKIVPLLIEAIKEQQTQIEELKELVNQLIKK